MRRHREVSTAVKVGERNLISIQKFKSLKKKNNAGRVGKAGEESGKETSARGNSEKRNVCLIAQTQQPEKHLSV